MHIYIYMCVCLLWRWESSPSFLNIFFPLSVPLPPENLAVLNRTSGSVLLTWEPGYNSTQSHYEVNFLFLTAIILYIYIVFFEGENAEELLCIKEVPLDKVIIYIYRYMPAKCRIHAYKQETNKTIKKKKKKKKKKETCQRLSRNAFCQVNILCCLEQQVKTIDKKTNQTYPTMMGDGLLNISTPVALALYNGKALVVEQINIIDWFLREVWYYNMISTHACTFMHAHTRTHTHMHTHTHAHIHTHTHARTHTHAHTPVSYTHLRAHET